MHSMASGTCTWGEHARPLAVHAVLRRGLLETAIIEIAPQRQARQHAAIARGPHPESARLTPAAGTRTHHCKW